MLIDEMEQELHHQRRSAVRSSDRCEQTSDVDSHVSNKADEPVHGGGCASRPVRFRSGRRADVPQGNVSDLDVFIMVETTQMISSLREMNFLQPSISSFSSFHNTSYYTFWISVGIRTWINTIGIGAMFADINFEQFSRLFHELQSSGVVQANWFLTDIDLKKLFWLSGSGFAIENPFEVSEPRMTKLQFCLLLLWLGPSTMKNAVTARDAIFAIYRWIQSSTDRVRQFYGICSRQSAITALRLNPGTDVAYHLCEGRKEYGRLYPSGHHVEFFCRNLISTVAVQNDQKIEFQHDMMLDLLLHDSDADQ